MNEIVSALIGLVGWAGAAVTVGADALVTNGHVSPSSTVYQGLNIGGAAALALSATASGAWPSAVTNLIWIVIGIQAVVSLKHIPVRLIARRAALRARSFLADLRDEPSPAAAPTTVGPLPLPIR